MHLRKQIVTARTLPRDANGTVFCFSVALLAATLFALGAIAS